MSAPRSRPQSRTGASLLPSMASSSSTRMGSSHTGNQRLSSLLWRLLCGSGVFYVALVWYSGMWRNIATISPSTDPKHSELSPQEMVARDGRLAAAHTRLEHGTLQPQLAAVDSELGALVEPLARELNVATPAAATATMEPTITHDTATAERNTEPNTAVRATDEPAGGAQNEFLDAVKEQIKELAKATQAPPTAQVKSGASNTPSTSARSLTPKEVFHMRLMEGDALTARQAIAQQAVDHAARLAKEREEAESAATMSPEEVEEQRKADEHAKAVKPMARGETKRRRLKCIGWRATEGCDPNGKRKPSLDRSCVRFVEPNQSGYCEVEDRDTGERFRVMMRQCDSLHTLSRFRCFESWDFSNFAVLANDAIATARSEEATAKALVPAAAAPPAPVNGILIVIYPKLIPSAYAIVRTLRAQNCTLPIEFWYRTDELSVETHPTLQVIAATYGPVSFRSIEDQRATGFATKISAIRHSGFDNVLFLDADNFPVRDPTYLFEVPEFKATGALFWPDFWHPDHTIFNIHKTSLLWELVDMEFVDMFEQESGQLVIDRTRHAVALALMQFYTFHRPNHFEKFRLAHGDKDLFRLAWLKSNATFHMVQHPPGVAGKLQHGMFCGMTMVQHDPSGDVIFLHRNAKKLTGRKFNFADQQEATVAGGTSAALRAKRAQQMESEDPAVWTHMLIFKPTSERVDFVIDIYEGTPAFPAGQWCYGKKELATPHFNVFEFAKLPYAGLETEIRAHAVEATEMVRAATLRANARAGAMRGGRTILPPTSE